MARWRRRSKAGPSAAPTAGPGPAPGLNGVEELRGELDSLKAELTSAQAEASQREQRGPHRSRRGIAVAAGVVTVGAGVTAGLLVSQQGSQSRLASPVTATPRTRPSTATTRVPLTTRPATGTLAPPAQAPATQPPTTRAATGQPPTATPSTQAPTPAIPAPPQSSSLIVVGRGQSFWSIAQAVENQALGRFPSTAEVTRYWLMVIAANRSRLARPGDPNLLYVGQLILLPRV